MGTLLTRTSVLGMAALAGLAACALAAALADHLTRKTALALGASFLLFVALLLAPQPRHVLLFAWAASLTYYRTYLIGDSGPYGPYWMRSDLLLASLFAWWAFEAAILKRRQARRGSRLWPYLVPFTVACILGLLEAEAPARGLTDVARVVKFGLVLWYAQYNIGWDEIRWSLSGVGAAICAQGAVGIIQVTTGKLAPGGLDAEGWLRASGTMVHPNIFAPYLLLVTPVFLTLAAGAPTRRSRWLSLAAGGMGIAGVACSMSRAPWVLMALEVFAVLAAMAAFRFIRAGAAAGVVVAALVACGAAALPFAEKIEARMLGNLNESFVFRAALNDAALAMFVDHPLLGVGLNHFALSLPAYDHSFDDALNAMEQAVDVNERPMTAVHNFYLLILAETGLLGLASMLFFLCAVVWRGFGAIRRTSGPLQGIAIGLMIGLGGMLLEEGVDFSLWMDPALFTLALVAGVLGVLPPLARPHEVPAVLPEPEEVMA